MAVYTHITHMTIATIPYLCVHSFSGLAQRSLAQLFVESVIFAPTFGGLLAIQGIEIFSRQFTRRFMHYCCHDWLSHSKLKRSFSASITVVRLTHLVPC